MRTERESEGHALNLFVCRYLGKKKLTIYPSDADCINYACDTRTDILVLRFTADQQ